MNYQDLMNLVDNEGLTLKNNKPIEYKTGYQVAVEGVSTRNSKMAIHYIKMYNGNCGIWKSKGVYYIDKSYRVNTKKQALLIGRACQQLSVYCWSKQALIWC